MAVFAMLDLPFVKNKAPGFSLPRILGGLLPGACLTMPVALLRPYYMRFVVLCQHQLVKFLNSGVLQGLASFFIGEIAVCFLRLILPAGELFDFDPHPYGRGDAGGSDGSLLDLISIHAPRVGGDCGLRQRLRRNPISIHAPT